MKIIKSGKKSFIATCRVCGCKFEYTIGELTASNCVYCPECGRYVYHEDQSEDKFIKYNSTEVMPDWVTTSTDLPMTEIRLPSKDAKSNIEYVNDNYSNGTASDAIFWE